MPRPVKEDSLAYARRQRDQARDLWERRSIFVAQLERERGLGGQDDPLQTLRKLLSDETQRRERFEEDCECAHMWLDDRGAPRIDKGGEVFSLVGRMMRLLEMAQDRRAALISLERGAGTIADAATAERTRVLVQLPNN